MKIIILVAILVGSALSSSRNILASSDPDLSMTASFEAGQPVLPSEQIELLLSRPLRERESRIAILIGTTDLSALFVLDKLRLRYNSKVWPLPLGQSELTAYLVSSNDEWKEIARFTLLVNNEKQSSQERSKLAAQDGLGTRFLEANYFDRFVSAPGTELIVNAASSNGQEPAETSSGSASKKGKMTFLPSLTFGFKSQPAQSTFPASDTPGSRFHSCEQSQNTVRTFLPLSHMQFAAASISLARLFKVLWNPSSQSSSNPSFWRVYHQFIQSD